MTGCGSPPPAPSDPPDIAQSERVAAVRTGHELRFHQKVLAKAAIRCQVVVMNLTPSFERETGQVILEGLPAGAAGEASLIPVPGLDLAFDRADGRLCRVVVDATGTDGSIAVGEQVAAMLTRLFGAQAPSMVSGTATGSERAGVLSPEAGLAGRLSSLARLDAARATSPVPSSSPWWAAEAAELAEQAGLHARARAEGRQALANLLGQPHRIDAAVLPEPAVRAALAVAAVTAVDDPAAAARLKEATEGRSGPRPGAPSPIPPPIPPLTPEFDVAEEVKSLEKDRVRLGRLHWMLDPDLVPEGVFRPGLSPYSDLRVRHDGAKGRVIVDARLTPGADYDALGRCQARLVDPAVRRVLAHGGFVKAGTTSGSWVRAELRLPFPLDELQESWIEVVQDHRRPVHSTKGHRIRRALRWADAALRAERAPAGVASKSDHGDWAALAAAAWERCRRDWDAAGDRDRAYLAARRQAALDPRACVPQAPSAAAAEIAGQAPLDGPAYLAEALGR